jgi:hypothetical protein
MMMVVMAVRPARRGTAPHCLRQILQIRQLPCL